MIAALGARSDRLSRVASLRTSKGRQLHGRYAFEGPTLLEEAARAGVTIEEVYATQAALDAHPTAASLGERLPLYVVAERSFARLSDLDSPSGLLAVAAIAPVATARLFDGYGPVLVLAGLNDPGNAGTLLRSALAFGSRGVVFGEGGVDPFSPKVVRAAMGAFFRLEIALADPQTVGRVARAAGFRAVGLEAGGMPLDAVAWGPKTAIVVGHERRGLGPWRAVCAELAGIQIEACAESLNAAVAGSIALYEAAKTGRETLP